VKDIRAVVDAVPGRVQSYGEPGSQAPQRVRAALHASPYDPVVTPVLEPIDCQSAAGAVGFRRYRLDLMSILSFHENRLRDQDVSIFRFSGRLPSGFNQDLAELGFRVVTAGP
jgi:hypothetical protein